LVADIFRVSKLLCKDLVLPTSSEATPPASHLAAAITATPRSSTYRFETLSDNDDTADDENNDVHVTPALAIHDLARPTVPWTLESYNPSYRGYYLAIPSLQSQAAQHP
jgi:hypothetical protein